MADYYGWQKERIRQMREESKARAQAIKEEARIKAKAHAQAIKAQSKAKISAMRKTEHSSMLKSTRREKGMATRTRKSLFGGGYSPRSKRQGIGYWLD